MQEHLPFHSRLSVPGRTAAIKSRHQTRQKRWDGSLGMYRPQGDGSLHAVLEEGQQHFSSVKAARDWFTKQKQGMDYVATSDGLIVGWNQQARPGDGYLALRVEVWQILIDGEKPRWTQASPSKIRVSAPPHANNAEESRAETRCGVDVRL
jgi:hypothetical protein